MEIEEYNAAQQTLTAAIVAYVLRYLAPFVSLPLTNQGWQFLLQSIYSEVERYRTESARLGRDFYDYQREKHVGGRHDLDLANYEFEWFREAMEPSKDKLLKPGASEHALSDLALRVAKEVENGGRRTIERPIRDEDVRDPEVKAWARVATGLETCGFCLMLISRGPVYLDAESAGMDVDDTSALDLIESGDADDMNEAMTRWHPGCDCKVVPVFDYGDWPGRDAYLKAEQLWKDATKGYSGKDALNALRRALDSGDVDPRDFAVS